MQVFGDPGKANKKFREWSDPKKKHQFEIPSEEGVSMIENLTIGQALTLYQYAKQKGLEETFKEHGWEVYTSSGRDGVSLRALKDQIIEKGGKEAIDWAEWQVSELYPQMYHRLNEKYRQHMGTDLDYIINFSPVVREKKGTTEDLTSILEGTRADKYLTSVHTNASKVRTNSKDWFDLKDANELMYAHIERASHYIHFQDPVNRLEKVFGNKEVRRVLERRFGRRANEVMEKFRDDIAHDHWGGDKWIGLDKLKTGFVRAKLGFNLVLFPKQMVSTTAFRSEVKPEDQLVFTKYMLMPDFGLMKQMAKNPYIKSRYDMGLFNREIAAAEKSINKSQVDASRLNLIKGTGWKAVDPRASGYMKDNMMVMTKLGDLGAILYGGQALYKTQLNKYKGEGYGVERAQQMAFNDFVRGVRKTQQSGAIEDLSHLQRRGSWGRMLTLFQNTPLQYLRIELAAMENLLDAKRQGDRARQADAAKTLMIYHFVLPATFHAASKGFYIDDITKTHEGKDASWLQDPDVLEGLIMGSLQYAPLAGEMALNTASYINTGSAFSTDIGIATDLAQSFDDFRDIIGESIEDRSISIEDVMKAISLPATLTGMPTHSLFNLEEGIRKYIAGETDDVRALLGYSPGTLGDHNVSRDFGLIHKHIEGNGNMSTMLQEYYDNEPLYVFDKEHKRLTKEYMMYDEFGKWDKHVNHLHNHLETNERKARYIWQLYMAEVEGQTMFRRNVSLSDIGGAGSMTEQEFNDRLSKWVVNDVISREAYGMFLVMKQQKGSRKGFDKIFKPEGKKNDE
jgi:hypothetical protein